MECKNCTERNTAEHLNPDCHTERCAYWKEYREKIEADHHKKWEYGLTVGTIADGYTKRKIAYARSHRKEKVKYTGRK